MSTLEAMAAKKAELEAKMAEMNRLVKEHDRLMELEQEKILKEQEDEKRRKQAAEKRRPTRCRQARRVDSAGPGTGAGEGGPADGQPDPQPHSGPRVRVGDLPDRHLFRCRGGEGGQAVLDPLPGQVSFPSGQVPALDLYLPVSLLGRSGH